MPSSRYPLSLFACLVACSTKAVPGDAGAGAGADSGDGGITCTSPLPDAGFSTLADLPIAELCASSALYDGGFGRVEEWSAPCGITLVHISDGIDCGGYWVFDTTTGAMAATLGACGGNSGFVCMVAPGFSFPNQCFADNKDWGPESDLCPAPPPPCDGGCAGTQVCEQDACNSLTAHGCTQVTSCSSSGNDFCIAIEKANEVLSLWECPPPLEWLGQDGCEETYQALPQPWAVCCTTGRTLFDGGCPQ